MAKEAFSKKKNLTTSKLNTNLMMKLVHCYIWGVALRGTETWLLRKVDQKYLESSEMWCCGRMEISWTDRMKRSITKSQGGQEYRTYSEVKEG